MLSHLQLPSNIASWCIKIKCAIQTQLNQSKFIFGTIYLIKKYLHTSTTYPRKDYFDHATEIKAALFSCCLSFSISLQDSVTVSRHFSISKSSCWAILLHFIPLPYLENFASLGLISQVQIRPATAAPCCFYNSATEFSLIVVFIADFWLWQKYHSLIICLVQAWASNLLQNHLDDACLRCVDSIQFGQRGKVQIEVSWKWRPDLSRDGSVIIALWFANELLISLCL